MKYEKVTKAQVKAHIRKGQVFEGFIVGCKVNEAHFFGGWHLAFSFNAESIHEFESYCKSWGYYNANSETGMRPHYYRFIEEGK